MRMARATSAENLVQLEAQQESGHATAGSIDESPRSPALSAIPSSRGQRVSFKGANEEDDDEHGGGRDKSNNDKTNNHVFGATSFAIIANGNLNVSDRTAGTDSFGPSNSLTSSEQSSVVPYSSRQSSFANQQSPMGSGNQQGFQNPNSPPNGNMRMRNSGSLLTLGGASPNGGVNVMNNGTGSSPLVGGNVNMNNGNTAFGPQWSTSSPMSQQQLIEQQHQQAAHEFYHYTEAANTVARRERISRFVMIFTALGFLASVIEPLILVEDLGEEQCTRNDFVDFFFIRSASTLSLFSCSLCLGGWGFGGLCWVAELRDADIATPDLVTELYCCFV